MFFLYLSVKTRFSYAFPKEFPYRMNHVSQFSSHYCIAIWRCIFTLFPASKKFRKFKFSLCSFQILECEFYLLELMVSGDIGALSLSSVFMVVCSIWLVAHIFKHIFPYVHRTAVWLCTTHTDHCCSMCRIWGRRICCCLSHGMDLWPLLSN